MLRSKEMVEILEAVVDGVPTLESVVFTGGEPLMLGEELITVVRAAAEKGPGTRIVTNGF